MERTQETAETNSRDTATDTGDGRPRCGDSKPATPIPPNGHVLMDLPIDFCIDTDAEPGDVVSALARLLIGMARQRKDHEAQREMAA